MENAIEVRGLRKVYAGGVEAVAGIDFEVAAGEVFDRFGVGAREPQPRLLHGVLGLARRAEHAVRDRL